MNTGRDRSAEARGAKVDHLDDAIDVVAVRLTTVAADEDFAHRVVSALPARSAWAFYSLAPRFALTFALGVGAAFVLFRSFDERSANVVRTLDARSAAVQLARTVPEHRTIVERPSNDRRTIAERQPNDRPGDRPNDFDRSLPALAAASALTIESLAPVPIAEDAPLTVLPLAIAELPLTAETISPRSVEEQ